jgi:hypothetical protein
MCRVDDYWPRVGRIPLYPDFATDDGDAVICRTSDNQPVRVTRPERFDSDEKRAAAIEFYELNYKRTPS